VYCDHAGARPRARRRAEVNTKHAPAASTAGATHAHALIV
jgi:hypothetical protein